MAAPILVRDEAWCNKAGPAAWELGQKNVARQVRDSALLTVLNATGVSIGSEGGGPTSPGVAIVECMLLGGGRPFAIWNVGQAVFETFHGYRARVLPRRQAERLFRSVLTGNLK